jgi:predicted pyridoxine 5'-phosphate oxidase superfamily flavin-nucleotide-binding protein
MVKLNPEIAEAFAAMKTYPLATASKDGIPNVAPMGAVFLKADNETIWIIDNFMKKTIANVRENPRAALYIWGAGIKGCFQIKCDVTVSTEGPDFEEAKDLVEKMKPGLPRKSLLTLRIKEVYQCMPGPEAGSKLL